MEKKYIVIVKGVLKFHNGEKVLSGGFAPPDTSQAEIDEKLEKKHIAEFDEKLTAKVQSANTGGVNIIKELQLEVKNLGLENLDLEEKLKNAETENADLKKKVKVQQKEIDSFLGGKK